MRPLVSLLVVVALLGGGFTLWYLHQAGAPATTFRTAVLARGDLVSTISATGTLEPEEVVDVGAQVVGMIREFGHDPHDQSKLIDYGTPVEEGTVLAQIDDELYQARLEKAQAQVAQAGADLRRAEADLRQVKAKYEQARRDWERAQRLKPSGAMAEADYDTFRANYDVASANTGVAEAAVDQAKAAMARAEKTLSAAQADLREARKNLEYTTIRSPVRGVIVDRRVNVGQTVVSSLNAPSLFLIAKDLKRMQIWASVNEADIGQIRARKPGQPGQPVRFTVDAFPGEVFQGEVVQVRLNATMTQNVVTYTVVVETDNSSLRLLPYLTANVQFEIEKRTDVLLVPNTALRWEPQPAQVAPGARAEFFRAMRRRDAGEDGQAPGARTDSGRPGRGTLWVVDDGFVRPREVQLGRSDGSRTEIRGGEIREGMVVAVGDVVREEGDGTSNPFTPRLFGGGGKGQP